MRSRLFEKVIKTDFKELVSSLRAKYEAEGFFVKGSTSGVGIVRIFVSNDPEFKFSWHEDYGTGLEVEMGEDYFEKKDDFGPWARIVQVVVAKDDRGKGIANKLLKIFLDETGDNLIEVQLADMSKGFWDHYVKKYPNIDWKKDF